MRLFKRGSRYYVEVERNKRVSLRTSDPQKAKTLFRQLERRLLEQKVCFLKEKPTISLHNFIAEYVRWADKTYRHQTMKRLKRILKMVLNTMPDKPLNEFTERDLNRYIDVLRAYKNSPVSINVHIRHIKSMFSQAVRWGYIKENPFKNKQLKVQKKRPNFLSPEEVKTVFKAIKSDTYKLVFALMVYAGLRRGEVARLMWNDINLNKEELYLRQTKNYEERVIPLHPELKTLLKTMKKDVGRVVPISEDQIGRRMKYWLREAGFGHIRPHDLRHTFASNLIMAGVDIRTVAELLGHKSLAVTQIYTHLLDSHKREAIKRLRYGIQS